jgi:signal transduction histidine kinase
MSEEQRRQLLQRIRDAATRQSASIDAILGLARLGRSRSATREVDLSKLAEDIVGMLVAQAPARAVDVRIAPELVAQGSPELLESLLSNLIGNAWKYSQSRDPAEIEFGRQKDAAVYFVRDNGVGFDAAEADRLFRPFQRLCDDAPQSGHGIGLATARRIVELHNGRVWAESEPGQGSTFYFTLDEGVAQACRD